MSRVLISPQDLAQRGDARPPQAARCRFQGPRWDSARLWRPDDGEARPGAVPLLIWALASAVHVPDLVAFGILIAASAALAPYRRRLDRKVRGMVPPAIHPEDRDELWADAVDATLADLLERNPGVDPAALRAARRAWQHNMSAAAKAHQLAYGQV